MIITPQETFLNLEEAAVALACDPETVRALASSGELRGRKVGRAWVFTASALAAYCNAGEPIKERKKWRSTRGGASTGAISSSEGSALANRLALIRSPKRGGASAS